MLYRAIASSISLFYFLLPGHPNQFTVSSVCPSQSDSTIRSRGASVTTMSTKNDNTADDWESVPIKKKTRNRKPSGIKQTNPYVEVIDVPTGEPTTTDADPEPFLVLLVGLIGSGKSTFAQTLVASMPDKFCRINQDELKTRQKCERKLKQVLSESPRLCPIIDRCNFDAKQRSTWYKLAEEDVPPSTETGNDSDDITKQLESTRLSSGIPVDVVVLDIPHEECLRRCGARRGHETIKSPQQAAGVLKQLRKQWSPPHHSKNASEKSRYRSLTVVRTEQERKACLRKILRQAQ